MTIQVLIPRSGGGAPPLLTAAPACEPPGEHEITVPSAAPRSTHRPIPIADRLVAPSSCPLPGASTQRSPYQAKHQAELLCLQAEADALLQKLQALQTEKRSASAVQ